MTHGSLFTGVGGIDLGFSMAGISTIWQVEKDPLARGVLTTHWPETPKFEDVRLCGEELEKPDIISAGLPCQPHSVAGKRGGQKDARHLWPEVLRIIHELGRPRFIFLENVLGFITSALESVIDDLEISGYRAWPVVLGPNLFGAPHRRNRLFIVAHANETHAPTAGNIDPLSPIEKGPLVEVKRQWSKLQLELGARVDLAGDRPDPGAMRAFSRIPRRMDRLGLLGNSVCPQIAYLFGCYFRRIYEAEQEPK